MHGRVADHDRLGDFLAGTPDQGAKLASQIVHRSDGGLPQFLRLLLSFHSVGDAGDHVLAIGNLGVHHSPGLQGLPRRQINQVGSDLGRPQVYSQAQGEPSLGQQIHQLAISHHRVGHPIPFLQAEGDMGQEPAVNRQPLQAVLSGKSVAQTGDLGAKVL